METKRMITAICIAMLAVLGWQFVVQYIAEKNHWTLNQSNNQPATQPIEANVQSPVNTPATEMTLSTTQASSGFHVATSRAAPAATRPAIVSIGSGVRNDPTYAMEIAIDPRGASVGRVALNQFKQTVDENSSYTYEQPLEVNGSQSAALATDWVALDGQTINLSDVDWELIQHTASSAMFEVTIDDSAGKPAARVVKTYEVFAKDDRRQGYEAHVVQTVENLSGKPLTVGTKVNGTVAPIQEMESVDDRQILAGYPVGEGIEAGHETLSEFANTPKWGLLQNDKDQPMRWIGASSVYFLAIVRPEPAPKTSVTMPIAGDTSVSIEAFTANSNYAPGAVVSTPNGIKRSWGTSSTNITTIGKLAEGLTAGKTYNTLKLSNGTAISLTVGSALTITSSVESNVQETVSVAKAANAGAEAVILDPNPPAETTPSVQMTLSTGAITLNAGASAELPLSVFFGPKKRSVIASDYYSALPLGYDSAFRTMSHGFCGFCAFQPVIIVLVDMLRGFHFVLRDWGLAIIALVAVVRLILHPITRSSTVSMQKMSKMGPEMEKVRAKYKDNPEELNKAMMQFYKEQGATPILGCLPMFLQTPIWIALWEALQSTFELRQAPFLHPFGIPLTWIHDLSKPDSIYTFAHPIPLLMGWHLHSINLLPLLMGVVMYLQQKFTPRAPVMKPEQAQQQKMMILMSTLLFPLMLYTGPSGLNLYIFTSSAVGIWEYKIIRDHIKRREEAENSGQVIVAGPKKWRRGGGNIGEVTSKSAAPTGGLGGWLAKMQAMAEQVRREQEKKKRQK